jgi:5-methyltetrahydropteroyltriglutamate--homocysteine methyltransferase
MWHREGHYDAIAEKLFAGLQHRRLLLEYDTERAGGFEPLRFVPKGKIAVLGLIATKFGRVKSADELRRRIDEAACYLPLEQLPSVRNVVSLPACVEICSLKMNSSASST